jgi:hypothetical protein
MHIDTTHMHNENSYLESPNPLFLDIYILKPNSTGYGYTYTYHANTLLSIMHRNIYTIIIKIVGYDSMHIRPLCMCIFRLFHIFGQQCPKHQEDAPQGVSLRVFMNLKRTHKYRNLPLQKQLSFDFFISFPFHRKEIFPCLLQVSQIFWFGYGVLFKVFLCYVLYVW